MMRRALIGHTGFVGSNLRSAGHYTDFYNSSNFTSMIGEAFDEIVCSGISAAKWLANREPEQDWADIQRLLDVLARVRTKRFVLISTIDVYPDPSWPFDESDALEGGQNHPYGKHRLAVEKWVSERFDDHLIVRLPALFGPGLKKNALYDLLHDNQVDKINPSGAFQWYPVERLNADLQRAETAGLRLVNLFTAPVVLSEIIHAFFPDASVGPPSESAPTYNLRTRYAHLFGGSEGFIMSRDEVMAALGVYVARARHGRSDQPAE